MLLSGHFFKIARVGCYTLYFFTQVVIFFNQRLFFRIQSSYPYLLLSLEKKALAWSKKERQKKNTKKQKGDSI
jgi:hypothetical protein